MKRAILLAALAALCSACATTAEVPFATRDGVADVHPLPDRAARLGQARGKKCGLNVAMGLDGTAARREAIRRAIDSVPGAAALEDLEVKYTQYPVYLLPLLSTSCWEVRGTAIGPVTNRRRPALTRR